MMTNIWRTTMLPAGASLLLAACGGPAKPAPRAGDDVPILFGEISPAPSHTPLYVAINRGFFKKAGLDVSIQKLTGGTPSAMAAMATGSVNMMMAGSTEFIEYLAKGVIEGRIVAEVQDSTFDVVTVQGITAIGQLKGKTLGISGLNGGDQIYLEAVLRHAGVPSGGVTFLTTGNSTNRLTALSSGAVQAIAVSNSMRRTSSSVGSVLLSSDHSPVKIPTSMIFADRDLIANRKPMLQRFVRALSAATAWVKANRSVAMQDCQQGSGASAKACAEALESLSDPALAGAYTWSANGAINETGMKEALAAEAVRVPESRKLKLDDVIDSSIAGALR